MKFESQYLKVWLKHILYPVFILRFVSSLCVFPPQPKDEIEEKKTVLLLDRLLLKIRIYLLVCKV